MLVKMGARSKDYRTTDACEEGGGARRPCLSALKKMRVFALEERPVLLVNIIVISTRKRIHRKRLPSTNWTPKIIYGTDSYTKARCAPEELGRALIQNGTLFLTPYLI